MNQEIILLIGLMVASFALFGCVAIFTWRTHKSTPHDGVRVVSYVITLVAAFLAVLIPIYVLFAVPSSAEDNEVIYDGPIIESGR